jgi:hypothetical protein
VVRFCGAHARGLIPRDLLFKMEAHFVREFPFDSVSAEQSA